MSVRFEVTVELALGADITADPSTWSWSEDITAYTYVRDGGVRIARGRLNEQSQAQPSSCTLLLNNGDGRFSRLNPLGAYYGQLTKNTPLRIQVDSGSGAVTRFVGFVSQWPKRWEKSGNDFWVPVRADGVMRRLGQDTKSLNSPMRRYVSSAGQSALGPPVAYWPLEGGENASLGLPAIGGGVMLPAGPAVFGADSPAGSNPLLELSATASISAPVEFGADNGGWMVGFLINAPTALTSGTVIARWTSTGTVKTWTLSLAGAAPDTMTLVGTDASGAAVVNETRDFAVFGSSTEWYGYWLYFIVSVKDDAGSLDVQYMVYDATTDASIAFLSTTLASSNAGTVTNLLFRAGSGLPSLIVGHAAVWNRSVYDDDFTTLGRIFQSVTGFPGDTTATRVTRLGLENDVQIDTAGTTSAATMGPQSINTLLGLFREAEASENGVLVERRTGELGFDRTDVRLNADSVLTLVYTSSHLDDILPDDDDQLTANDWTVSRSGGASARVEQTDGPMGTDPITGAGRYAKSVTLSLEDDEQAYHQAGWRVNLGTVNEYRYPVVSVKLHNSRLAALLDDIAAVDISQRITITGMPTNLPPDDVELVVEGYTELINNFEWEIAFNCSPYRPYQVGVLADTSGDTDPNLGWLDWDTCTLDTGVNSSTTTFLVNADPLDTTAADDFPRDCYIGGELVTVTACSGASQPQTWTVTRSVNGVVKSHLADVEITLANPVILTL